LPKRIRCPHCDRLFSRDSIDGHIPKCRLKKHTKSTTAGRPKRKNVIVDGNNVAYYLSPNGKPQLSNLLSALKSLRYAGLRPVIVISSALKHKIDKPDALRELISTKEVVEAPRGTNDDLHIIRMAQKTNSDIVTNDRFLDWRERHPWLDDRLRRYRMTPSGLILT
jgi:hypothetical protein